MNRDVFILGEVFDIEEVPIVLRIEGIDAEDSDRLLWNLAASPQTAGVFFLEDNSLHRTLVSIEAGIGTTKDQDTAVFN